MAAGEILERGLKSSVGWIQGSREEVEREKEREKELRGKGASETELMELYSL